MINWEDFVKERSWSTEARSWYFSTELSEKKRWIRKADFLVDIGTDIPRTQMQNVTSNMLGVISQIREKTSTYVVILGSTWTVFLYKSEQILIIRVLCSLWINFPLPPPRLVDNCWSVSTIPCNTCCHVCDRFHRVFIEYLWHVCGRLRRVFIADVLACLWSFP